MAAAAACPITQLPNAHHCMHLCWRTARPFRLTFLRSAPMSLSFIPSSQGPSIAAACMHIKEARKAARMRRDIVAGEGDAVRTGE